MRPFDITHWCWPDYEPPGLCHTGIETIGAIASVVGTGVSALSAMSESKYEAAVARNQAVLQQQKANEDAAIGQRQAITAERKTQLVLSKARALAAGSGTDATSPTQVDIEGEIARQGGYNALSTLYDGMARSRGDTEQADIDLFKASRADAAGPLAAGGALLSGASRLALGFNAKRGNLLNLFD